MDKSHDELFYFRPLHSGVLMHAVKKQIFYQNEHKVLNHYVLLQILSNGNNGYNLYMNYKNQIYYIQHIF